MFTEATIEKFKLLRTPFFYYDLETLRGVLREVKEAAAKHQFHIHYAMKANANDRLLQVIKKEGFGADCVSGNEITKAIGIGFTADTIAFAGVGKSDEEIQTGLQHDIFSFNSESAQELDIINQLAGAAGKKARIALRINPNVNANTHHYTTTGLEENKFGISRWELDEVLDQFKTLTNLELVGFHFHIGSQVRDLQAYRELCLRANEIQQFFIDRQVIVEHINLGGGLGVNYEDPDNATPDFTEFFGIFQKFIELRPRQTLHFELGRALVATCSDLISKVLFVKNGIKTNFAILDAGMTELIRPALYQAYHKIENLTNQNSTTRNYDVVGPICESSDCFGKAVALPETQRGDLLAIRTTGAYGEVMSSGYNLRDKAGVVYADEL